MNNFYFFVALTTLVTIVNPVGALVPFLTMTVGESAEKRRKTAFRASFISGAILASCAATGAFVFKFYGITLPALKIAGGILLFFVAVDMVNARTSRSKSTDEEEQEGIEKDDVAVFPLAIPLLSGPGSILSVFMLEDRAKSLLDHGFLYLAIILTSVVSYLTLKFAPKMIKLLGQIGINVMSRLMGLILAAIAVQFIVDGLIAVMPGLGR